MNIYIAHSSSFDFKKELYNPIKNSVLINNNNFIFPHENSDKLFNSKDLFIKHNCDLVIAEVTNQSTSLGIELGWANLCNIKIICIYKKGIITSKGLQTISKDILEYSDEGDLISKISDILS